MTFDDHALSTGILYHAGDRLVYHPDQPLTSRVFVPAPTIVGLQFENVYIRARDKTRLHLFMVKQPTEKLAEAPTVLFLHGNAGNIGHRLLNAKGMFAKLSCNLCLLEYRGYGRSDGTPSEEGLYMDAQAGLDYLSSRSDINPNRIIVFGRSLGETIYFGHRGGIILAFLFCNSSQFKFRASGFRRLATFFT